MIPPFGSPAPVPSRWDRWPKAPAFTFCGDRTIRDWHSGQPLPAYEGLVVHYNSLEPWLMRTALVDGERTWDAVPRAEWGTQGDN